MYRIPIPESKFFNPIFSRVRTRKVWISLLIVLVLVIASLEVAIYGGFGQTDTLVRIGLSEVVLGLCFVWIYYALKLKSDPATAKLYRIILQDLSDVLFFVSATQLFIWVFQSCISR